MTTSPDAPPVAVISDGYWERRYARNPSVVGERLLVNGVPVTIAGVSPPGFVGAKVGSVADVTMPVAALPVIKPDTLRCSSVAISGCGFSRA